MSFENSLNIASIWSSSRIRCYSSAAQPITRCKVQNTAPARVHGALRIAVGFSAAGQCNNNDSDHTMQCSKHFNACLETTGNNQQRYSNCNSVNNDDNSSRSSSTTTNDNDINLYNNRMQCAKHCTCMRSPQRSAGQRVRRRRKTTAGSAQLRWQL